MKRFTLVIFVLALFVFSVQAFQGNYRIVWYNKGKFVSSGSCIFYTAKAARDAANTIIRDTGSSDTFKIKTCKN